jgi:hypothetical protein
VSGSPLLTDPIAMGLIAGAPIAAHTGEFEASSARAGVRAIGTRAQPVRTQGSGHLNDVGLLRRREPIDESAQVITELAFSRTNLLMEGAGINGRINRLELIPALILAEGASALEIAGKESP